jgi:hypothetical protein
MEAVHPYFARLMAALLLLALVPVELGGSVAAQTVLEADACVDHEDADQMRIEQPSPDAVDFLEVEDDEASIGVADVHTTSTRPLIAIVADSPAHVHLDDHDPPPRG